MAKKSKKAKAPKATTKGVRAIDESTPAYAVRKACIEHPLAPVGEIEKLLGEQGHEIDGNTLRGLYQGGMGLLKVADHLGYALTKK